MLWKGDKVFLMLTMWVCKYTKIFIYVDQQRIHGWGWQIKNIKRRLGEVITRNFYSPFNDRIPNITIRMKRYVYTYIRKAIYHAVCLVPSSIPQHLILSPSPSDLFRPTDEALSKYDGYVLPKTTKYKRDPHKIIARQWHPAYVDIFRSVYLEKEST